MPIVLEHMTRRFTNTTEQTAGDNMNNRGSNRSRGAVAIKGRVSIKATIVD